jgi:hypothetical protein
VNSLLLVASVSAEARIATENLLWLDAREDREGEYRWSDLTRARILIKEDGLTAGAELWVQVFPGNLQRWEMRPLESKWKLNGEKFNLTIGLQTLRWGQLDALSVVDILSPRELRFGPVVSMGDIRQPAPSAAVSLDIDRLQAELICFPFSPMDRFDLLGTSWSLLRAGDLENILEEMQQWGADGLTQELEEELLQGLQRQLEPKTQLQLNRLASPNIATGSGDVGGRLRFNGAHLSTNISGGRFTERTARIDLHPSLQQAIGEEELPSLGTLLSWEDVYANPFELHRLPFWMLSADLSSLIGPIGVRAEGTWRSTQSLSTPSLDAVSSPMYGAALGADWSNGIWLVGTEARWQSFTEAPKDLWLQSPQSTEVAAFTAGSLLNQRLFLELQALYVHPLSDVLVKGGVSWSWSVWKATISGLVVDGQASELGKFSQGGPLGYWKDNDGLGIEVAWAPDVRK